jgi:hypothetical protein
MIPQWNSSGVIPPIRPHASGASRDRSPYTAQFSEVVSQFGTSVERIAILQGLLEYRRELALRGIVNGFQWLDGSFMENKEALSSAPPNDIDVVTFFHLPKGQTQQTFFSTIADLFNNNITKPLYHVDAYPWVLGKPLEREDVKMISYWYSMWSHRRSGMWKGFVQLELSSSADQVAEKLLNITNFEGAAS